jgi:uncharacterized protein (DUF2235 family)
MSEAQQDGIRSKNIVICCDGTDNEFGGENTNVFKLFSVAVKRKSEQIAFYDPGVGTFSANAALTPFAKWMTKKMGSAFGYGISRNIADSYEFLVDNYEWNDRIFLFGFSRGAYTVRALAALIHACGLLHRQNRNLIPYVIELFKGEFTKVDKELKKQEKRTKSRLRLELPLCTSFAKEFSVHPNIHFLGLWDTVTSVGSVYNPLRLPFTHWNPSVHIVRHAISIDERRKFFRQNLWSKSQEHCDIKQIWFAGVHADVGGGYPEVESGLAKISLEWMLTEATESDFLVDMTKRLHLLPPAGTIPPPAPANPKGLMHDELRKWGWKLAQWIPRRYEMRGPDGKFVTKCRFSPKQQPRYIENKSRIHHTVLERMTQLSTYRPVNLPNDALDENGDPLNWKAIV